VQTKLKSRKHKFPSSDLFCCTRDGGDVPARVPKLNNRMELKVKKDVVRVLHVRHKDA